MTITWTDVYHSLQTDPRTSSIRELTTTLVFDYAILSSGHNIKVNVLTRGNNELELCNVQPVDINQNPRQIVLVVKSDDHYDALVPQSKTGSHELNLTNVMHNVTSVNATESPPSYCEATSSKCTIPNDAPSLSSGNNHLVNFNLPFCNKLSHRKSSLVHDNFISRVKRHRGLKISHHNVRRLDNMYDEIMSILTHSQLDIFCLNETLLDNTITNTQIHILGYVIERSDRYRGDDIDYE